MKKLQKSDKLKTRTEYRDTLGLEEDRRKILAWNLRIMRRIFGLTQDQVAQYLHVIRSTYSYYEQGKTLPSIFTLQSIAAFYGITVDQLMHQFSSMDRIVELLDNKDIPAYQLMRDMLE